MVWNDATVSLVITGLLFAVLQGWWIASLLQRNRRRRHAEPLSQSAFRQELDRIFHRS